MEVPPSHAALDGVAPPDGREPEPWGSRGHLSVRRHRVISGPLEWLNHAAQTCRDAFPVSC
jgi:hypothetical protein